MVKIKGEDTKAPMLQQLIGLVQSIFETFIKYKMLVCENKLENNRYSQTDHIDFRCILCLQESLIFRKIFSLIN